MRLGVRTNEDVDKLVGSDLVFTMVSFVDQVTVGTWTNIFSNHDIAVV